MDRTNVIDFEICPNRLNNNPSKSASCSDELIDAIRGLIQRVRDSSPLELPT